MTPDQRSILRVLDRTVGKTTAEVGGMFLDYPTAEQDLLSLALQGLAVFSSRSSGWVLTEEGANYRVTRMAPADGDEFSDVAK